MTLKELYDKLPVSKHPNLRVVMDGKMVLYDDGTAILRAWLDIDGELVPDDAVTRTELNQL